MLRFRLWLIRCLLPAEYTIIAPASKEFRTVIEQIVKAIDEEHRISTEWKRNQYESAKLRSKAPAMELRLPDESLENTTV